MSFDAQQYIDSAVKAKASKTSQYITHGKYVFGIRNLLIKPGRKDKVFFIAEHATLKATKTGEAEPNAVGSEPSYMTNLKSDNGPANLKAYFLALFGLVEGQIEDAKLNAMISKAVNVDPAKGKVQPCRGMAIGDNAFVKEKKDGEDFTVNDWSTVPETAENASAEVDKRRAEYGGDKLPTI